MDLKLLTDWELERENFELLIGRVFEKTFSFDDQIGGSRELKESIKYALFSGGKRFRPMLSLASSQAINKSFKDSAYWAVAVEFIHTYSLIHDDLPSMDNDDERRGQPTVHIKFNEPTALLAGDALLTEAFTVVARNYSSHPKLSSLILQLTESSGFNGMISGQANDLYISEQNVELGVADILLIHRQKTSALISAACLGPFLISNFDREVVKLMQPISMNIGLLFQFKDDFLDAREKKENNVVQAFGENETLEIYQKINIETLKQLDGISSKINILPFKNLMEYNDSRKS